MPEFLVNDTDSCSRDLIQQPPRPEDVRIRRDQSISCSKLNGESKPEVSHANNPQSSRLDSSPTDSESRAISPLNMTSKESKLLYINVVTSLLTWTILAGITVLPDVSAFIRNSRALEVIERAGNTVLNTVEDIPPLVAGGVSREPSCSHAPRSPEPGDSAELPRSGEFRAPEPGDSGDWPDLAIIPSLQKKWALGIGRYTFGYIE
ncbi:hypothetical protein ACLOAV_010685 [Pseudogymnoascus australis]